MANYIISIDNQTFTKTFCVNKKYSYRHGAIERYQRFLIKRSMTSISSRVLLSISTWSPVVSASLTQWCIWSLTILIATLSNAVLAAVIWLRISMQYLLSSIIFSIPRVCPQSYAFYWSKRFYYPYKLDWRHWEAPSKTDAYRQLIFIQFIHVIPSLGESFLI